MSDNTSNIRKLIEPAKEITTNEKDRKKLFKDNYKIEIA